MAKERQPGWKHTDAVIAERVEAAYDFRYNQKGRMKDWVSKCKKVYGDRCNRTYEIYWNKAKEQYTEVWQNKIEGMIQPAMDELLELLQDGSERARQTAIDQILRYSGNAVQKIDMDVKGDIKLNFDFDTPNTDEDE